MLVFQFGFPDALELLFLLLVLFLFVAPIVVFALFLVNQQRDEPDRVTELEARVEELEAVLEIERVGPVPEGRSRD